VATVFCDNNGGVATVQIQCCGFRELYLGMVLYVGMDSEIE